MSKEQILSAMSYADSLINANVFNELGMCYTSNAMLIVSPGEVAIGRKDIVETHKRTADDFKHRFRLARGRMEILVSGDIALVISDVSLESPFLENADYPVERKATYVYKKCEYDIWKCHIDNSYGVDLL